MEHLDQRRPRLDRDREHDHREGEDAEREQRFGEQGPAGRQLHRWGLVTGGHHVEGLFALSAASRADVDHVADAALAAGGTFVEDPQDYGFMYTRSFQDLDGHSWSVLGMDPNHLQK